MPFSIGTVSKGTLKTVDLIRAFASEIRDREFDFDFDTIPDIDGDDDWWDTEEAGFILDELREVLEAAAPEYVYFGILEGDGAHFGFWPDTDQLQEAIQSEEVGSGSELPDECDGRGFAVITDHGNVTYWASSDSGWVEVWSCV